MLAREVHFQARHINLHRYKNTPGSNCSFSEVYRLKNTPGSSCNFNEVYRLKNTPGSSCNFNEVYRLKNTPGSNCSVNEDVISDYITVILIVRYVVLTLS